MQECARVCQSIPEYARQRRANNSVFEYYSNNIRIPKYSYSYSVDFFKPNNIRIRIRSFFGTRIIFVFVFGPQNTIRSPLCQRMQEYARVCKSMQEYARVCQSMPDYARVCQKMP